MKARAPGKIVLSGAYAVLEGAPAIVSAVDRYVTADLERHADFITEEVKAARFERIPWFDASDLRTQERKLGLGSSAAILVASLATRELARDPTLSDESLAHAVFPEALQAHRVAQPLGSGIDVCSSCFGGTRLMRRRPNALLHEPLSLPSKLYVEIWAAPHSSSTGSMLAKLRDFRLQNPSVFARLIGAQATAAERAANATLEGNAESFIAALAAQREALQAIGSALGVPIVTADVANLAEIAAAESAVVVPAGAGGGDLALFVASHPPSEHLRQRVALLKHEPLPMKLGVRGVHGVVPKP